MLDINDKKLRFLILGYGVSGRSTANFLINNGYSVTVFDDLLGERLPDIHNFDVVVKSPGIPFMPHNVHHIVKKAQEAGISIISNYDIFAIFNNKACIISITGTNGKSTTTALSHHILSQSGTMINAVMGGNIGIPYGDLNHDADVYMFEMSSYELAISKYMNFEIGCVLNIEPDHLENHGSFENYIKAKHNCLDHSKIKIISYEDEHTAPKYKGSAITISSSGNNMADIYVKNAALIDNRNNGVKIDLSDFPELRGRHNHQNAAFAYAICSSLCVSCDDICKCVRTFESLPHRLNVVKTLGNTTFVNDSKATNPSSGACALDAYSGYDIYWIVGGRSKKTDIHKHVDKYMDSVVKIYLIGESMDEFSSEFNGLKEIERCENIENAVARAFQDAAQISERKSIVLFSPICASFDQFNNYEERGDYFCEVVRRLTI